MLALVALVVVAIVGAVTWVVISDSESGGEPANVARVGKVAPDFELETLDGRTVRLSELRGKPVLVNFWASWCTPCRDEFPFIQDLVEQYDDLEVLGVTEDTILGDARRFVEKQRATWPMLDDSAGDVARQYGVKPIPQTFFIDRNGIVTVRVNAPLPLLSSEELDAELAKISRSATTTLPK
ncbi:MAG: TlpA disulfide reductase family protein [Acidimicrobiia bacterium]